MTIILKKKYKLSFFYKYLVRKLFNILYGNIIFTNQKKFANYLKILEIKNPEIRKQNKEKYKVYEITNGRIFTDFVENVAVIDDNKIIEGPSYQQVKGVFAKAKFNSAIQNGTPYLKKKVYGNVLSLTQGASGHSNYFHWLFDILPKIKLCSEIIDLDEINYFYTSKLLDFQKKTLRILNLDHIKILDSERYRHIQAEKILATDHPWYNKGYVLNEVGKMPPWILKWIREKFLPYKKKINSNEKVFIDRSESKFNHCQIQNNSEVIDFLTKKGFTSYKIGELSFENQIYLFNKAKIIVGAHGAAFANLVFCKPKTKIIEIKPINNPNYVNKTISKINSLDYTLIATQKLDENLKINGDIYLDLKRLNKIV